MLFPHQKFGGNIKLNELEQTTPCLLPLVKSKVELAMVRERFRDGGDLASGGIECEHLLIRTRGCPILKEATLVR